MKVLEISCGFSYSTVYSKLFSELNNQGFDVEVYVPQHKNIVNEKNIIDDLPFHLYSSKIIRNYDKFLYYTKIKRMTRDIELNFKLSQISLAHAHSLFSDGGVALELKRKYNIPYIVAIRDIDVNKYFKYGIHLRKQALRIMSEAQNIVFISSSYKNHVIDTFLPAKLKYEITNKAVVLPNGIEEYWLENRNDLQVSLPTNDQIRIIYVGLVNKRKNIISTVRAIEKLEKKGYKAKLTIVGAVEDHAIYEKIIESTHVNYIVPKSKEELINIYRENHILVMPSITETFGLTYAEAMSQGLPVIYSKGQGFDGQFEEGLVGYHVDSFDIEEIADRVIDIMKNYKYMSENCIKLCVKFDWKIIGNNYKDIYNMHV